MEKTIKIRDVVDVLDQITGGRVVQGREDLFSGKNPFVVTKSSNIPGKAITEIPGLVWGDLDWPVRKIAVTMTLTECNIELAGATGVDVIIAHHPVADGASSGGVTLNSYLGLYKLAVMELHEAFHGLHPGISFIHGCEAKRVEIAYGGIPGNIMYVGKTIGGINTLGDILDRLEELMSYNEEAEMLAAEKRIRGTEDIQETNVATGGKLFNGSLGDKAENILHIFPHTGFSVAHLEKVLEEHPEIDTVLATISRPQADSDLVTTAKRLGLNFIAGNSHAMEIFENGLPLASALNYYLQDQVEIVLFRERITAVPLKQFGSPQIRKYANYITEKFLVKND